MSDFEHGYQPPEKPKKPTAEQVRAILNGDRDMSGLDINNLRLNGFDMKGCDFTGCDARGIDLSPETKQNGKETAEKPTDIRETNWTDATFASAGEFTSFKDVNAKGAIFGFKMTLAERQQMIAETIKNKGRGPNEFECGGYFNFDGTGADFSKTKWINIDFGGGSGYEAFFDGADFKEADFKGCNMSNIDLSNTKLDKVKFAINEPDELFGMVINSEQIEMIIQGISLNNPEKQRQFEAILSALGSSRNALEVYFRLVIID